jgi:uncharacterized sporulation protein YeaH/YhbH (DUF444 family)
MYFYNFRSSKLDNVSNRPKDENSPNLVKKNSKSLISLNLGRRLFRFRLANLRSTVRVANTTKTREQRQEAKRKWTTGRKPSRRPSTRKVLKEQFGSGLPDFSFYHIP